MTEYGDLTETLQGHETEEGHMEYELAGDRTVIIQWNTTKGKKTENGWKGKMK
jgi:hypothetical protein